MNTSKLMVMLLVLGSLMLAGCQSTPAGRIASKKEAFAAMPADVQAKIRAGEVAVGFTEEQVLLAKGKPSRVAKRTKESGESVVWIYERPASGLGFGLGIGGGSGGLGGGVGVSTGGGGSMEVLMQITFTDGVVTTVDDYAR